MGNKGGSSVPERTGPSCGTDRNPSRCFNHWTVLYTNLGSLMAKYDELLLIVTRIQPFCILIAETWLKSTIPDTVCSLPGYRIFRADHPDNRGYDGVCVFIRERDTHKLVIETFSLDTPGIDNIFLTVKSPALTATIGCVYRPRACPADIALVDGLARLSADCSNLVVAGDFNIPELKWPLQSIPQGTGMPALFAQMLTDTSLSQLIQQPTRFRLNQTPSTIDLLLTNDSGLISDIQLLPPLGKSDHACITFALQSIFQMTPRRHRVKYSHIDYAVLSDAIAHKDWYSLLNCSSVHDMWDVFLSTVSDLIQQSSSLRSRLCAPGKPWITGRLLSIARSKKRLWQKFRRSRSDSDFLQHRILSNSLSQAIRQAKTDYEDSIISGGNCRQFYKYVRSRLASKVSLPLLRATDGSVCSNNQHIAEMFADSFSCVFAVEPPGPCPAVTSLPRNESALEHIDVTPEEVEAYLMNLDIYTSPGPDGLTALVLKRCAATLSIPLCLIYRTSFAQGILPNAWLSASITPIFKKGDKLDPGNYRPISLVTIAAKVAERVILKHLLPFLLDSHVISDHQHGFLPGRSVITNLLECVNSWTKALDKKIPVDVVYLDFSKAFERVPRRRLLHKLDHFGIRGPLLSWIESFLTGRSFSVRVADQHSLSRPVASGVPQGSVLGPILFLLYTSDLAALIKSDFAMYADDLKLYGSPSNKQCMLQQDLVTITNWCLEWLLPLNPSKCSVLHLGFYNPQTVYTICGAALKPVDSQCDLGVLITSNMSWSEHIINIVRKANKSLYLISKAFSGCSLQTAVKLFTVYVRPILEFAGPVWCPILVRDSAMLESLQRRATRLPYGAIRPSYEERLVQSGLTSFCERRLRGDLIVCYRALHGLFGTDVSHMFELSQNQHLRGHSLKLKKENFTTVQRQCFLPNRIFDVWNRLPERVVSAVSVNSFKNGLDELTV